MGKESVLSKAVIFKAIPIFAIFSIYKITFKLILNISVSCSPAPKSNLFALKRF